MAINVQQLNTQKMLKKETKPTWWIQWKFRLFLRKKNQFVFIKHIDWDGLFLLPTSFACNVCFLDYIHVLQSEKYKVFALNVIWITIQFIWITIQEQNTWAFHFSLKICFTAQINKNKYTNVFFWIWMHCILCNLI